MEKSKPTNLKTSLIKYGCCLFILLLSAILFILYINFQIKSIDWNVAYLIATAAWAVLFFGYIVFERKKIMNSDIKMISFAAAFAISVIISIVTEELQFVPLYMIGGIFVASVADINVGLLIQYFFLLNKVFIGKNSTVELVIQLIAVTSLCFIFNVGVRLIRNQKVSKSNKPNYEVAETEEDVNSSAKNPEIETLLESVQREIAQQVALSGNTTKDDTNFKNTVLSKKEKNKHGKLKDERRAVFHDRGYRGLEKEEETTDIEENVKVNENTIEKPVINGPHIVTLLDYCNETASLLMKLSEVNLSSYRSSVRVAHIAENAALAINADSVKAKAVSLYMEISRIEGTKDIPTTKNIATNNHFPYELTSAICEVISKENVTFSCKETAIVKIISTVLTSYFYLKRNTSYNVSIEKIVESTISQKVFSGAFDECGISVRECSVLRNYLIGEIEKIDKESRNGK